MQYRVNPRNGDRISALGLGCMRFPGPHGRPDPRLARELVARALDRGVNYLDTAYLYPGNESCVGSALEELGAAAVVPDQVSGFDGSPAGVWASFERRVPLGRYTTGLSDIGTAPRARLCTSGEVRNGFRASERTPEPRLCTPQEVHN